MRSKTAADYVQAPNVFKFIILVATRAGEGAALAASAVAVGPECESGIFFEEQQFSSSSPPLFLTLGLGASEWD